jgi:hypothetical protein
LARGSGAGQGVRVPGGKERGTPADLACTIDAGKRDAGEAKKGVRAEVSEEERDTKREGEAKTDEERRLAGKRIDGEDERLKFCKDEKVGEDEK